MMEWVSRGYSAILGNAGVIGGGGGLASGNNSLRGPEEVDKLCDRLVNSTLLEDRRAAVLGLRSYSREFQLVDQNNGFISITYVHLH